ncbi:MAG: low molecular weight phosphotyrosine protein phosphatase [Clostridia bacterium]|nr:low molecular weight phosphotyrosine protein phosphatase [Clostridia bacterium]
MIKILFICHGNICRSPMAEFVMREYIRREKLDPMVSVASAATSTDEIGCDIHYGTREVLTKHGIPFERRAARQTTKRDYGEYNIICGMDAPNMRNMRRIYGGDSEGKLSLLLDYCGGGEVADPWYTGNFDATWNDVTRGCRALLNKIKTDLKGNK